MRAKRLLGLGILILLVATSCSDSEEEMNMEIQLTNSVNIEENAMINCILEDILCEVEKNAIMADNGTNIKDNTKSDSIPSIKVDRESAQSNRTKISIDYGSSNQLDHLGRNKRGKITNHISGRFLHSQALQKIEFIDFHINGMKIEGEIDIECLGYNESDQPSFSISFEDVLFIAENGLSYSISGSRTKEWVEGFNTPEDPWDDQFFITGDSYGINSEEREYRSKISTALLISRACEFILSGETEFEIDEEMAIYNFGDGLCDNKAFYTKKNKKTLFELGRYSFRRKE